MSEEQNKTEAAPEKAKKGMMGKLLIVVVVVILSAGGGVGAFFALGKFGNKPAAEEHNEGEEGEVHGEDHAEAPKPGKRKKKREPKVVSVVKLEPFVANLADPGGVRYLRVKLSLGLDAELQHEGKEKKEEKGGDPVLVSQIRDAILQSITQKKADELLTAEGKQKLREEIIQVTAPLIHGPEVVNVFFTEFVVQ